MALVQDWWSRPDCWQATRPGQWGWASITGPGRSLGLLRSTWTIPTSYNWQNAKATHIFFLLFLGGLETLELRELAEEWHLCIYGNGAEPSEWYNPVTGTYGLVLTSTHFLGRFLSAHCLSLISTAVLNDLWEDKGNMINDLWWEKGNM